ncbi:uncharacterized protein V1513DRAFT_386496, partial [Lipomyces chichibuensis]|uniref:uncharacterized protein n=1 Tax=Lipomyces chichibuensis TaxID=1546026 RepID=UPI003343B8C4
MAVDTEGGSQDRNINRELGCGDDDRQFAGDDDDEDVGMDHEDKENLTSDVESDFSDDLDELSGDDEMDIFDVDIEQEHANVFLRKYYPSSILTTNAVRLLLPKDAESVRWLLFKVMHRLDNVGFSLLGNIPQIATQYLYTCRKTINECTGLIPIKYDCCHLGPCVCYFGEYQQHLQCPKCAAERFSGSKKPNKTFNYIPLEPRIRAIFSNERLSKLVQEYPCEVLSKDEQNFWNGNLMRKLRGDGFFRDPTEIALA